MGRNLTSAIFFSSKKIYNSSMKKKLFCAGQQHSPLAAALVHQAIRPPRMNVWKTRPLRIALPTRTIQLRMRNRFNMDFSQLK